MTPAGGITCPVRVKRKQVRRGIPTKPNVFGVEQICNIFQPTNILS